MKKLFYLLMSVTCIAFAASCDKTSKSPKIPVESVSLNHENLELTEGDMAILVATIEPSNASAKTLKWSSDDDEVASVEDGIVTAEGPGETIIRVAVGGKEAICPVKVNPAPIPISEIDLDPESLELTVGESADIVATVYPDNATDPTVSWSSDDTNVATVDNGHVVAVGAGQANIIVSGGEVSAQCHVTVSEPAGPVVLFFDDFENDNFTSQWTIIDKDGDGFNWYLFSNEGRSTGLCEAHSGDVVILSESYYNDTGTPLTPDNWLISPAINLGDANNYLTFWICGQDLSYALEHYAVYATTDSSFGDSSWTKILEGTVTQGYTLSSINKPLEASTFENIVAKVPDAFNGKTAYFAIRHFDCTDMFIFNFDDFGITVGDPTGIDLSSPSVEVSSIGQDKSFQYAKKSIR